MSESIIGCEVFLGQLEKINHEFGRISDGIKDFGDKLIKLSDISKTFIAAFAWQADEERWPLALFQLSCANCGRSVRAKRNKYPPRCRTCRVRLPFPPGCAARRATLVINRGIAGSNRPPHATRA
jgi:hypothetical protein